MSRAGKIATLFGLSASNTLDPSTGGCPAGVILPFAGSAAPSGWLFAYGQAVSRTTYATLFAALSTTYGTGDGTTTFNLPDLRGRVPACKDDMGGTAASRMTTAGSGVNGLTLGAVGGAEVHTLTTAQMPAHNHTVTDPGHNHNNTNAATGGGNSAAGGSGYGYPGTVATGTSNTGITIGNNGSGSSHNNVQPTVILNYIIKT